MQQINRYKPDIRIYCNGLIEIFTSAARRIGLSGNSQISFYIDEDCNTYLRKVDEGMKPSSVHGACFLRFHSIETVRLILGLPDIPKGITHAGFRIGEPDDGTNFPIITRRIL